MSQNMIIYKTGKLVDKLKVGDVVQFRDFGSNNPHHLSSRDDYDGLFTIKCIQSEYNMFILEGNSVGSVCECGKGHSWTISKDEVNFIARGVDIEKVRNNNKYIVNKHILKYKTKPDSVQESYCKLGCDPELFIKDENGNVIGSEKYIPDGYEGSSDVTRDGIQAELNPSPNGCRQLLSHHLFVAMSKLASYASFIKGSISSDVTVKVTKKEMDSLSDESKQFGCSGSYNAYNSTVSGPVIRDASKYFKRSAGGHIHIGLESREKSLSQNEYDLLAKVFDIVVGNTCVLIDRDRGNKERRLNYGRAGEYRLPSHGFEYRTLSNFWLIHYVTFSFVFRLSRIALSIWRHKGAREELLSLVNEQDIVNAINNNDKKLAQKNFNKIKHFLNTILWDNDSPFSKKMLQKTEKFLSVPAKKRFGTDIIKNWYLGSGGSPYHRGDYGYEYYLTYKIK